MRGDTTVHRAGREHAANGLRSDRLRSARSPHQASHREHTWCTPTAESARPLRWPEAPPRRGEGGKEIPGKHVGTNPTSEHSGAGALEPSLLYGSTPPPAGPTPLLRLAVRALLRSAHSTTPRGSRRRAAGRIDGVEHHRRRQWPGQRRGCQGGASGGRDRGVPGHGVRAAADHGSARALARGHPLQRLPRPRLALPLPAPRRRPVSLASPPSLPPAFGVTRRRVRVHRASSSRPYCDSWCLQGAGHAALLHVRARQ